MNGWGEQGLGYPEALAAIGRFIAKKELTDVCVLEFENGLIVTGAVLFETSESYNRRVETHIFSEAQLREMVQGRQDAKAHTG